MLKNSARFLVLLGLSVFAVAAQQTSTLSTITKSFVSVDSTTVALEHVRVIDGTGAAGVPDQTVLIESGKIHDIGKTGAVSVPAGALRMDLTGRTVIPGLVGMHDHLFYPSASGQGNPPGATPLRRDGLQFSASVFGWRSHFAAHDRKSRAVHRPCSQEND